MDALPVGAHAFSLALASEGETVRIVAYSDGRGVDRKMADLGLTVGSELTILTRQEGGRMVVARDAVRVALGIGLAHRIMVAQVQTEPRS